MSPWAPSSIGFPVFAHALLVLLYGQSWTLWALSTFRCPGRAQSQAQHEAYRAAVAAIAAGEAEPGLEAWLVHSHQVMMPPRSAFDSFRRVPTYCQGSGLVGGAVMPHNTNEHSTGRSAVVRSKGSG